MERRWLVTDVTTWYPVSEEPQQHIDSVFQALISAHRVDVGYLCYVCAIAREKGSCVNGDHSVVSYPPIRVGAAGPCSRPSRMVNRGLHRQPVTDRDKGFYPKQQFKDKLTENKLCIDKHGQNMPEIRHWKWARPSQANRAGARPDIHYATDPKSIRSGASGVLASLRGSTYRSVRLASSLAAALLDSLFEHPAEIFFSCTTCADH